jgi:hypothetical protein
MKSEEKERRRAMTRSGAHRTGGLVARAAFACALAAAGSIALAASSPAVTARAARTISIGESGHLVLTSRHGFTLNEAGSATGTIRGTIYIHLHLVSTNHVTAEVNIYPRGGSISGSASASYRVNGATASFAGTLNVDRGSGSYSRAHGSGLSFSGIVRRSDDAVTVRLSGRISD